MFLKKLDFKQPKYIVPLITLPFLFFFNYVLKGFSKDEKDSNEKVSILNKSRDFNTELPSPNGDSLLENKYASFRKLNTDIPESIKAKDEERRLDSLRKSLLANNNMDETIQKIMDLSERNMQNIQNSTNGNIGNLYPTNNSSDKEKQELLERIKMMDSALAATKLAAETNTQAAVITKTGEDYSPYFNSIKKEKKEKNITAILDEGITVVQGSRIRIRLLDDIQINNTSLKKGNYLYATIQGFQSERILLSVNTVLLDNKIVPINLDIYDNDGLLGLHIPKSAFRDVTKELTEIENSINTITTASQNVGTNIISGAVNSLYNIGAKALKSSVKKNKAKLKYNTIVYLIPKD